MVIQSCKSGECYTKLANYRNHKVISGYSMNHGSYTVANRIYETRHPLEEEVRFDAAENYVLHLSNLAVLAVEGAKAADFLQGQLTCDVRLVTPSTIQRGALCNLKGRIMALLDVIDWQGYHLVLQKDLIDETKSSLAKAAMLSRLSLQVKTDWHAFGFLINNSSQTLPRLTLPDESGHAATTDDYCCYSLGNNLFLALIRQQRISHYLEGFSTSQQRGPLGWHYLQLLNRHVTIYPETRGLFLAHRIDLHKQGYISFDKGCYKGQEIIARTHYKAKLKHELKVFTVFSNKPPVPGSRLFNEGTQQEIGELVDCCPKSSDCYLIAVSIQFEHAQVVSLENQSETLTLLDALESPKKP
ncbi:folate-binding protein YgfZ [Legionella sp. MW5194]|nr:folate-binding protein YgfZ [Legionella sp. MW5194]